MNEMPTLLAFTPKLPAVVHTDTEFRMELPFGLETSNLYYVGVNHMENWSTTFHYHDHYELCYLDYGYSQYKIDKTLYTIHSSELLVTKPGEVHFGLAGGGEQTPFKLYYIGFHLERLSILHNEFYQIGLQRIAKDMDGTIKALFEQIINEIQNKRYLGQTNVEGMFQQLLVQVLRLLHDPALREDTQPKPLQPTIINVINRLHREVRYDHDLDELARTIPVSRSHLAREFKSAVGIPIGTYIRNLCLDKAKSELRATTKSITQIAEELQFSSIHTFSIFFKRFSGCTPSDYRKMG
jgi:AraC-like DNA-binding protein